MGSDVKKKKMTLESKAGLLFKTKNLLLASSLDSAEIVFRPSVR